MNKFKVFVRLSRHGELGENIGDTNVEVYNGDYTSGDMSSVCNCLTNALGEATEFKENINSINRANEKYGFAWTDRFEIIGIIFSFYRADSTIINEVNINSIEEIALTSDILTNFCLV